MDSFALALICLLPALVIAAALHDVATMTIPNWISAVLLAGFVPVALVAGLSLSDIAISLLVGLAALLVGMGLFAFNLLGGGDAKLMSATAVWLGLAGLMPFVAYTVLAGGAVSLVLLVVRRRAPMLAGMGPAWFGRLLAPQAGVPYGVAIAAGALLAFPTSPLVLAAMG